MSDITEIGPVKLSKRYLMSLPVGKYLVSGVGYTPTRRFFMEYVTPLTERHEQWKRVVEASADQRCCYHYESAKKFKSEMDKFLQK
jgi:hypothetical protein